MSTPTTTMKIELWFTPENVSSSIADNPVLPKLERIGGAANCD